MWDTIAELLKDKDSLTVTEVMNLTDADRRAIRKHLNQLVAEGVLVPVVSAKGRKDVKVEDKQNDSFGGGTISPHCEKTLSNLSNKY